MKLSNLIKLFSITLIIASCADEQQKPLEKGMYRINGMVNGLDNGEIYLTNYSNTIDTIKVENGEFTIEKELEDIVGKINLTKDANVKYMDSKLMNSFFIEPSIMTLDLNYMDFSKSKLTGSTTQDDQYRFDSIRNEIQEKHEEVYSSYKEIRKNLDDKFPTATEKEKEKLKDEEYYAKEKLQPMYDELEKASIEFIKQNPKSFVSVQSLLFQLKNMQYEEAKAIVDQFNPDHLKIGFGARLVSELENMRKGIIGAKAGNFDTVDINGNPLKLADFKGQYLLIDFWASWCVPCRKGNPHLIELYKKYNPKGLEVLGVASDDNTPDKWRKAVEKDQIGIWHHVLDGHDFDRKSGKTVKSGINDGYNISTLPTKILVDPDGKIVGRYGSGGGTDADMDKDLAELFN